MVPKISIITPSYNQAGFLEQTIDSVLSQGYSNLEYIIIDGGSTDGSVDIIKKHQKYLAYWISEADQGQTHAINKGLKFVTGEVFNWLNSDDYYLPNTLKRVGEYFMEHPEINVLSGGCEVFGSGTKDNYLSKGTQLFDSLEKTIGYAFIEQPATFFRTGPFKSLGGLNERFNYLMDRELWVRYLLHFNKEEVIKVDDLFVRFRHHEKSKTVSQIGGFQEEEDHLFLSLAQQHSLKEYIALMDDWCLQEKALKEVKLKIKLEKDFVCRVLDYYLLHRADIFYSDGNRKRCQRIIHFLDKKNLRAENQLIKKLKFRSSFVGFAIVSAIKSLIK